MKNKTLSKLLSSGFLMVAGLITAKSATAQRPDTAIFYFKNTTNGNHVKTTPDSADFIRIILAPDPSDKNLNVMEYNKERKLTMVGKADPDYPYTYTYGDVLLAGDCITYFPNGKKNSIAHYVHGQKEGLEYRYNDNGTIYCVLKHLNQGKGVNNAVLNWECYDPKGNNICTQGNGWWISYEKSQVALQGAVKNGLPDGLWKGSTKMIDSIKYTYLYKDGKFISGTGYDKTGRAYPFGKDRELAKYNQNDPISFIRIIRSHFKLPEKFDDKKINLDTAYFTFIVEKDNSVSHIQFLGFADTSLNRSLRTAFLKCKTWSTVKFYGVPMRLKIILPFREREGFLDAVTDNYTPIYLNRYSRKIDYKAEVIGDEDK